MIAPRMMEGCMIRRCCFASLVAAGTAAYHGVPCCWLPEPGDPKKKTKKWFTKKTCALVMPFDHQNEELFVDMLLTTTSCHMPSNQQSVNMTSLFQKPKIDRSEIDFFKATLFLPSC
jgi:hypothetical protein